MAEQTKDANINEVWASSGDTGTDPGTGKRELGFIQEKPTFQLMNHILNLLQKYAKHNNEQGISDWDASTNYAIGGLAKGSDDVVYRSLSTDNVGVDPVGENADWEIAFISARNHQGNASFGKALVDWHEFDTMLQIGDQHISDDGSQLSISFNAVKDSANGAWRYKWSQPAPMLVTIGSGDFIVYTAPTGTAGGLIYWTKRFSISESGMEYSGDITGAVSFSGTVSSGGVRLGRVNKTAYVEGVRSGISATNIETNKFVDGGFKSLYTLSTMPRIVYLATLAERYDFGSASSATQLTVPGLDSDLILDVGMSLDGRYLWVVQENGSAPGVIHTYSLPPDSALSGAVLISTTSISSLSINAAYKHVCAQFFNSGMNVAIVGPSGFQWDSYSVFTSRLATKYDPGSVIAGSTVETHIDYANSESIISAAIPFDGSCIAYIHEHQTNGSRSIGYASIESAITDENVTQQIIVSRKDSTTLYKSVSFADDYEVASLITTTQLCDVARIMLRK